jgi:hypothetical protein
MDDEKFEELVKQARIIKERYVDPNRDWYAKRKGIPFAYFRMAGVITILFSVALPAVAAIPEAPTWNKQLVLSAMSVTIAALTGLSSFYRWERTWRGRAQSKAAIDALTEKWELELTNARLVIDDPAERLKHVYLATNDLLTNFRGISATETEEFFAGMAFPQSDRTTTR